MNMLMHTQQIKPEIWRGYWKHSIGFDRMVNTLLNSIETFEGNYPPYDIVKESDSTWRIVIALAGFKEEDIAVEQKENIVTIVGYSNSDKEYVVQGIAKRKFKKIFPLVEGAEVTNATLKNGLLEVTINVVIPEEKKPKLIPINNNS